MGKLLNSLEGFINPPQIQGLLVAEEIDCPRMQQTGRKKHGFGIFVSERGTSKKYLAALRREINKYSFLEERGKCLLGRTIKSAQFQDGILFGDAPYDFTYDYRLSDLDDLQSAGTKIYDLIVDFPKIKTAIQRYYNANYNEIWCPTRNNYLNCSPCYKPYKKKNSYVPSMPLKVNIRVNANRPTCRLNNTNFDKVQVFHNYVKVGFDQYDIYLNGKGKEFVIIDGDKYKIRRDSVGNRRLY